MAKDTGVRLSRIAFSMLLQEFKANFNVISGVMQASLQTLGCNAVWPQGLLFKCLVFC